jgi:hypothetical protein
MPLTSRLDNIVMKENTNTSFEHCTINFELPINFFLIRIRSKTYVIDFPLMYLVNLERKKNT